jgi:3-oxoacyl-[acyl-carrier-protein] synthase III
LVIGSEVHSTGFRYDDLVAVVFGNFGDGAGAAVLSREEDLTKGILSTHLHCRRTACRRVTTLHQEWEQGGYRYHNDQR